MQCYRDLMVWQQGIELVTEVYRISRQLPDDERFALSNQMQSAAVSIPSHIAEGHARSSRREFLSYLSMALGSLAELETHLTIADKLDYITEGKKRKVMSQAGLLGRRIRSLQKSLQQKAD